MSNYLDYEYRKPKTAPKVMVSEPGTIRSKVLNTCAKISELVGSTLGPSGKTVLIERNEGGLPPIVTKDGVTVAKSMSFYDPVSQTILESFRQAAIQVVSTAGDGTTSATILAYSILREMQNFLAENPQESAQSVLKRLQNKVYKVLTPQIKESAIKTSLNGPSSLLEQVAMVSTNHDADLTAAIISAFKIVGENGYISLSEDTAEPGFEIQKIKGFSFNKGYDDYLQQIAVEFINDSENQQIFLQGCKFLLIDGKVKDLRGIQNILIFLEHLAESNKAPVNLLLVCHGFTREIIQDLSRLWKLSGFLKIFPVVTEINQLNSSQFEFLKDLSAYTGARIFSPMTDNFKNFKATDLGILENLSFECSRYKSTFLGLGNETTILDRITELEKRQNKESKANSLIIQEKIGRLTGGVARIIVRGFHDAQIREVKDRAEDAICSIRSALKDGVVPGGCRILINLSSLCYVDQDPAVNKILGTALLEPFLVLTNNCGLSKDEINGIYQGLISDESLVYDARNHKTLNFKEAEIYDSATAVYAALNTAVEIATTMASLGGIITYMRDEEADKELSGNEINARSLMKT